MQFTPSAQVLDKYARVLVNFALNRGSGIKPNDVVFLQVPESAKLLLKSLYKIVLEAGAHPIVQYIPDDIQRIFFETANQQQIQFFPSLYYKGRVEQADHFLTVLAETNLHELEGIDPQKIMLKQTALKPYVDWRRQKETENKLSWTLALYATPATAKEAGLTLKAAWDQIISSCFLDQTDPVGKWKQVSSDIGQIKAKLNNLEIDKIRILSKDTDLTIGIGSNRRWLSGGGNNIPSFEIFTSPDWRRTYGHIYFDLPLYRHGQIIKNIHLEFKDGLVVNVKAETGKQYLIEMLKVENADKIGEFSLTDTRMSRINKFMAETLYDENYGGKYGNTHIALGDSFKEAYCGPKNINDISNKQWGRMGFNDSVIHTDIISTQNRKVTALLKDGSEILIYQDGQFTF